MIPFNKIRTQLFLLVGALLASLPSWGQRPEVEMADTFRADGKIYVVVAVALIIFLGMIVYLITIDRKVKKLEEEQNNA